MVIDILSILKQARSFPNLIEETDVQITFTIGLDDAGYVVGNKTSTIQAPIVDITGAVVKLIARRMPIKPSTVEIGAGYGGILFSTLFTSTGNITDAVNGVVVFNLTPTDLNSNGEFLMEIEVKRADNTVFVPIQYKFQLRPRLNTTG